MIERLSVESWPGYVLNLLKRTFYFADGPIASSSNEDADLIERIQYGEIPPSVEYSLTTVGVEVRNRLESLLEWAERSEPE